MADLTDTLTQMLNGHADRVGRRIGADESRARSAMHAAPPALLAILDSFAKRK